MKQYLELLDQIDLFGGLYSNRTGIPTKRLLGKHIAFDLWKGFPLVTTKKVHFKSVVYELLWLLKGDTNTKYLKDHGVTIWNEWADQNGDLGRAYGAQWRSWQGANGQIVDQISNLVKTLKEDPDSRRHILTAWNPAEIDQMALPPCHCFTQFHVVRNRLNTNKMFLACHLYMRSCDAFLGLPFNIASYALLTEMLAQVCGYKAYQLMITFGDLHIYQNHFDQVKLQLSREPKPLPKLILTPTIKNIFDFDYEDISLVNYQYHPAIKADVAV